MTTPFLPTPADTQAAHTQLKQLQAQAGQVPPRLAALLGDLLGQVAAGKAIHVVTLDAEIGTQQAADLLHVSRPYLVKLIDDGALPHRKVGPRRRLALDDVLAYKARLDGQRQAALQALADDLQEMDLG
ncbi:excisionase family DNA binding protein [Deinococcus metalli]|uniref:Excisionase n=1 Tax=Deinococcus metalli TaxID=1141878 RepID=A0A7W8KH61_9DEIO|nr:helix-turn-helix domain-containing protein [Deinococcus metalli]MBB5378032.1 excisionase family DNA binding protein [Deinococcus metalli]GHF53897.1 excisionase [Deinococcus metalli]